MSKKKKSKDTGADRLAFCHQLLEDQRRQTDEPSCRSQIGVIERRYHSVLNGVEKVLIDYADEIRGGKFKSPVVLWALYILGVDTTPDGWNPDEERAERMGW